MWVAPATYAVAVPGGAARPLRSNESAGPSGRTKQVQPSRTVACSSIGEFRPLCTDTSPSPIETASNEKLPDRNGATNGLYERKMADNWLSRDRTNLLRRHWALPFVYSQRRGPPATRANQGCCIWPQQSRTYFARGRE